MHSTKSVVIGFRLVLDITETVTKKDNTMVQHPISRTPQNQPSVQASNVSTQQASKLLQQANDTSIFMPVLQYAKPFTSEAIPFTNHNHDPSVVVCPSGDIYAIWFSTIEETGRESGIVQSWLRANSSVETGWEEPTVYSNTPDRMENAPLMWVDEEGVNSIISLLFVVAVPHTFYR